MKNIVFDEKLLDRIRLNMENFSVRTLNKKGLKKAAVALTVVNVANGPRLYNISAREYTSKDAALVLTKRSSRLKHHSGQWALPGGRMDTGERPEDTALRELAEEVGLELPYDNIIGRLDDFTTRSGYNITPVVVWGGPDVNLTPNPDEVASIHRIPITEFMRNDAPILEEIPESENPVLLMPVGDSWIAAPTAALLYQFREVAVLGNNIRVAHYEQPYFAWK